MLLMNDEDFELYDEGYSVAVDFWSLGVLIHELLIGVNFLKKLDVVAFYLKGTTLASAEYDGMLSRIYNHSNVSDAAYGIIAHFLVLRWSKRLGSGPMGLKSIKKAKFFQRIDWNKLSLRILVPPYLPSLKQQVCCTYESFDDMIKNCARRKKGGRISAALNAHFENWYALCICVLFDTHVVRTCTGVCMH